MKRFNRLHKAARAPRAVAAKDQAVELAAIAARWAREGVSLQGTVYMDAKLRAYITLHLGRMSK